MASLSDMTVRVKREPEAQPITFGDAVLLMFIAAWLFRSPAVSGWIVFLAFLLAWVTNLIYRALYPVADYIGASLVYRILHRKKG